MAWTYLIAAGILEILWAFLMKQSAGFTRLWPTLGTLAFMIASFALLSAAMRTLPLGTAYTVWTGIGAAGSFAVGIAFLGEDLTAPRVIAALMILGGVVLLKLASPQ